MERSAVEYIQLWASILINEAIDFAISGAGRFTQLHLSCIDAKMVAPESGLEAK